MKLDHPMSKYDKLGRYLRGQRGEWHAMSFGEIESVLGFSMPVSARKYRPWWANQSDGGHVQSHAWMSAGWRVWSVNFSAERVEFQRISAEQAAQVSEVAAAPFRHQASEAEEPDLVTFDKAKLNVAARRILDDYTAEFGGDVQRALDKALEEARIAYRKRFMDSIPRGTPSSISSVDLIREDRDAR
jgi:hypothetical protein